MTLSPLQLLRDARVRSQVPTRNEVNRKANQVTALLRPYFDSLPISATGIGQKIQINGSYAGSVQLAPAVSKTIDSILEKLDTEGFELFIDCNDNSVSITIRKGCPPPDCDYSTLSQTIEATVYLCSVRDKYAVEPTGNREPWKEDYCADEIIGRLHRIDSLRQQIGDAEKGLGSFSHFAR